MSTSIFKLLTSLIQKQDSPTTPGLPSSFQELTIVANEENVEVYFESQHFSELPDEFNDNYTQEDWFYKEVGLDYNTDRPYLNWLVENHYSYFEYRYDVNDQWTPYTINEILTLPTINSYVQFRMNPLAFKAAEIINLYYGMDFNYGNYSSGIYGLGHFNINKKANLYGDLRSMTSIQQNYDKGCRSLFINMFQGCKIVDISNLNVPPCYNNGVFAGLFCNCTQLSKGIESIVIAGDYLNSICESMFSGTAITQLPTIIGNNHILGLNAFSCMFASCNNLEIIDVSDLNNTCKMDAETSDYRNCMLFHVQRLY